MVSRGPAEFLRFAVVGAGGFAIDASVFISLLLAGGDAYLARAASAFIAVIATWWVNKEWTFRSPDEDAKRGTFPAYLAVQSCGLFVNYTVFAAVQTLLPVGLIPSLAALSSGAAAALLLNFAGARSVVFRRPS